MTCTLVLPQAIATELRAALANPLETAGTLLVSVIHDPGSADMRLLGREIHWVEETAYQRREPYGLTISPQGYVPALGRAESIGATAIWVHTHPGLESTPISSPPDQVVDRLLIEPFRIRSGSSYYGALIFSPRPGTFAFTGHVIPENRPQLSMDRLWIVGDRLELIPAFGTESSPIEPAFSRHIRAFGSGIQRALGDLRIAIIGCGGTGSAVAEQLVRLGVRDVTLVDPDLLSESNVTRVYGSTAKDVGKAKVLVLADHLQRIAPDSRVAVVQSMLTVESTARRLTKHDVAFGCTDDNAGRLVLSRVATYLLLPIIDCGVVLSTDPAGLIRGIDGRVTLLVPGHACLVCRGRIDTARAAAELLTPAERTRREDEGYAPALGAVEPAVVTFTSLVGAMAVGELLELFIGYGPEPRPSEVLLRCHEREISTNIVAPRERHYCHPDSGKLGIGMTEPFLEQVWAV